MVHHEIVPVGNSGYFLCCWSEAFEVHYLLEKAVEQRNDRIVYHDSASYHTPSQLISF